MVVSQGEFPSLPLAGKFIKTEGCASSRSEAIARRIAETGWSAFERV
jgi:hypothetical protein